MIDTHCHVNFKDYDEDRDEVVERAKSRLNGFIDSGFGYESNIKSLEQSREYDGFAYSTFGFHPVSSQNCTQKELDDVKEQVITHMDEIVAIGEVGMDFYYCTDKALRERQKEIFLEFVNIANEYRKPLVIQEEMPRRRSSICLKIMMTFQEWFFTAMEEALNWLEELQTRMNIT